MHVGWQSGTGGFGQRRKGYLQTTRTGGGEW
ncbi:hypothetical protein EV648_11064 [Kribbella sp. VKM Ac-2568]|nr:hypothetical protein EV648_11064 [Kribbella sp. VKM Ac-2568]